MAFNNIIEINISRLMIKRKALNPKIDDGRASPWIGHGLRISIINGFLSPAANKSILRYKRLIYLIRHPKTN